MSLRLRIEHGQDAGKTWRLPRPGIYTVGRVKNVSLQVLDMKVSKRHCEIHVDDGGAMLRDLGSMHGCLLNGQPVKQDKALNAGDELRLGMTIVRVLSDGPGDADLEPASGRQADGGEKREAAARQTNTGETKQTLPADDLVGKDLGGYQIERKIGAGGMGGVYLAEQTSLRRKVALKVLNENFAADSAFVDQFVNEARAAGALNHPNVVQVYDVGSAQGHYFFSMEVMPGGSIEDKVKEGPVEWETALNWFIDSANALIFAKRREILHRDVKPDNLMIGEDESAKLCDLGLAKKSEVGDLMDQGIIGTPHFISPEAIRRKADVDHRTDLYSLGCTFYRIFAGKNPYPGKSVKEILLGHLNKPVPRVNAINPDVPSEIDDVVARLMAKDPEERIQTPEELLRQLDKIRTTYNLEAHGIKPASKKPLVIGGIAAAVVIGILAFFIATREDTVIVEDLSPEEQARLDQAARTEAEKRVATSELKTRFSELKLKLSEADIEDGDNWKKQVFKTLSGDFKKLAETWSGKSATWGTELTDVEDEVIRGYYGDAIAAVSEYAGKSNEAAREIDAYLENRRKNEKAVNDARKMQGAAYDKAIADYVLKLKKWFDEGKYLEIEDSLSKGELDAIVTKYREATVAGIKLFTEKHLKDVLDKHLPGDKDGKNRGKKLVDDAVKAIGRAGETALGDATKALGSKPDNAEYLAAHKILKAHLASLPPEPYPDTAPRVGLAYGRVRDQIDTRAKQLLKLEGELNAERLYHDRPMYFALLKKIWSPLEEPGRGGYLTRFQFTAALGEVSTAQKAAQDPRYKMLVQRWVAPIEALEGLFKRVAASHPDGWTDDAYYYLDDKSGKQKKGKIKAVDEKEGVTTGKDPIPFADLRPRWLLENLFFFEGKPRMKECVREDHLGLALLGELMGGKEGYRIAKEQYEQAEGMYKGDPALTWIEWRLADLPLEEQASVKFQACADAIVRWETWAEEKQAMIDQQAMDPTAFPKEEREKLLSEAKEIEKQMPFIREMRSDLLKDAKLAGTCWGSVLRAEEHPAVAYAGERVPPPRITAPPPKKNDGKKDGDGTKKNGDGKDGDEEKDPVSNGGGEESGKKKKSK